MRSLRKSASVLVGLGAALALVVSGCGGSDDGGDTGSAGGGSGADFPLVSAGNLTVCSDIPYKPFEWEEGGSYTGFDMDLMQQIADGLGLKLVVKDSSFDGLQSGAALSAGTCDIVASAMTITDEREKNLDFSDPYYDSKQSLLVPTGSDITSIDDLSGHKVGIQQGTTGAQYAKENVPDGTNLITYPSDAELYPAIESGGVDAVLQDLPVNLDHTQGGKFEIVQTFDTNEQYGFAVKEEGSEKLLEAVNGQLQELRDNGEYQKLYDKYFSTE